MRRRAAGGDRRRRRHAALRLQRGDHPRPLPRHRRRVRRLSASPALRAEGELRPSRSRGCCGSSGSARRRQLDLGDRARAPRRLRAGRHRVHRRRQVATRSSNAPCRSGCKAINVESAGELARVEAIAARLGRRRARRHPHQPRHRRTKPSAHLDRAQDQQVRRAGRRRARAVRRRSRAGRSLRLVAIHVHVGSQITTLEPLRRAAAFVAGIGAGARGAGHPARIPRRRRRPRHRLRRRARRCRRDEYVGGARRRSPADRPADRRRAGPLHRRARRRAPRAGRRPQAARRRRASSRSSTPA